MTATDPRGDVVVGLRPMTRADLPDLLRWRREPHVARWFAESGPVTLEMIEERYGRRIDGDDPTRMFVVTAGGGPVGFLQDYRISDHPEFAVLAPDPDAIGVDYSIGDPTWLRRGVGLGRHCGFATDPLDAGAGANMRSRNNEESLFEGAAFPEVRRWPDRS